MNKAIIQQKLPAYQGRIAVITDEQNVHDIIAAIKQMHSKHAADYDKISYMFLKETPEATCRAIFNFLKKNISYKIEPVKSQSVKSPAALIHQGYGDCKHYSLFTAGILNSLDRLGLQKISYSYRFASYDLFDVEPKHVFVVAFPNSNKELWIDPVLKSFNERLHPTHTTDKKFKAMALSEISGVAVNGFFDGIFIDPTRKKMLRENLPKIAETFLYAFIPSGMYENKPSGRNAFTEFNIPQAVYDKAQLQGQLLNKVLNDAGMRWAESIPLIRQGFVTATGKQPEQLLNEAYGLNIQPKENFAFMFGVGNLNNLPAPTLTNVVPTKQPTKGNILQQAANLPYVKDVAAAVQAIQQIVSKISPKLFGTIGIQLPANLSLDAIKPDATDWAGWQHPSGVKYGAAGTPTQLTGGGNSNAASGSNNALLPLGIAALAAKLLNIF